jgi:hypothetical protein
MMSMKKITLISMILSLILSLGKASAITTLYVDPSSVTSTDEFTIDINVNGVTDLYGFEFKLEYDTSILDATGVTIDPFFTGDGECNTENNCFLLKNETRDSNGLVWVAAALLNPAAPKSGSGTLATITFQVTGSGSCALDLYDSILGDNDANPIDHSPIDGYFSSIESACYSDINDDGIVDIYDAITLALAFGSECYEDTCSYGHSCWTDWTTCTASNKPKWNPVADIIIDDDRLLGLVDIYDAITLGGEFGREDC